ncbi:hypothetical protein ACQ9BO_03370 [Flavobacterium sp. P21]|uniref:hypothetical protein n=1 Tax=Flavobacterium sp. P21 TaxID=3423948 RepID=UPI003D66A360
MRLIIPVFLLSYSGMFSQTTTATTSQTPKNMRFKDSLDGAIDLSNFLIYANGFLVVPAIISEPALGGFGGALAPIFLKNTHR